MQVLKNIVICADDFGMSENINLGVINLLKKRVINATSCMPTMPFFSQGIKQLKSLKLESLDVGIHLDLTEGTPLTKGKSIQKNDTFFSLFKVLTKSKLGRINYQDAYNELRAQIEIFIEYWGGLPDFVDGHQHIHHFPIIRSVLVKLYKEFNMYKNNTYIRSTSNIKKNNFKSLVIYYSGANRLDKLLIKNNIKHNTSFSGVYSLDPKKENFRQVMINAYSNIKNNGLIMCHPALDIDKNDPISEARVREYNYFISKNATLDQADIRLICSKNMYFIIQLPQTLVSLSIFLTSYSTNI